MADRSRTHVLLAVLAGALGVLAAAAGDPVVGGTSRTPTDRTTDVSALDVARWIRNGNRGVRVVDVRSDSEFTAYHIPGAEHVPVTQLARRSWSRGDSVILYGVDDAIAERAWHIVRDRGAGTALLLRGGLVAWIEQIAEPRLVPLPARATAAEQAARREHLALSQYFGGMPMVTPAGRSEAAAVARILRRGC